MTEKPKLSLGTDSLKLGTDAMEEVDGILSVPATLARQMIYDYGALKVLKPFEELEAAAPFADGIPVTHTHPDAGIVTDRAEILGFLKDPVAENDELKGILEISNKDLIGDIKDGKIKEVSIGFFCNLDHTGGSYNDAAYDAVQRDILLNHVAIVPNGRCSLVDGCGLHTDSVDSPPDLIGKLDTAIGMATNEWNTALKDLLVEVKEMIMNAAVTAGDESGTTGTDLDAIDTKIGELEAERDSAKGELDSVKSELNSMKAEVEKIIRVEKDAYIAELTAAQDSKTKEYLEKLTVDELKQELDMVNELRTARLSFKQDGKTAMSAIDAAYAGSVE